jgi:hypothetical protein
LNVAATGVGFISESNPTFCQPTTCRAASKVDTKKSEQQKTLVELLLLLSLPESGNEKLETTNSRVIGVTGAALVSY